MLHLKIVVRARVLAALCLLGAAAGAQGCRLDGGGNGAYAQGSLAMLSGASATCRIGAMTSTARASAIQTARTRLGGTPPADFCTASAQYSCTRRSFSPDAVEQRNVPQSQCADVAELGGQACLGVATYSFNTAEASRRPGVSPDAVLPGGDYNHDEYVCYHAALRDGDSFLAAGDGDTLGKALKAAADQCAVAANEIGGQNAGR